MKTKDKKKKEKKKDKNKAVPKRNIWNMSPSQMDEMTEEERQAYANRLGRSG